VLRSFDADLSGVELGVIPTVDRRVEPVRQDLASRPARPWPSWSLLIP
jgi:hypothetical protein